MEEKLVTVNTYAKLKDVTTMTVYNWIESGKIKSKEIDGVKFVIIEENE